MKLTKLTPQEAAVILDKGTEKPFTGTYLNNKQTGVYVCKQCQTPLYDSKDKFDSQCGWPSFDDEITGRIARIPDADGRRTEIVCKACGAHLGHVFEGEQFTPKDTRHCVNSISLLFVPAAEKTAETDQEETAYFASGCFWGTEYHLKRAKGVISTAVGYMGGVTQKPTYQEVCTGETGHVETTKVIFNTTLISYRELAILFFETHDFTQKNGQGPDIGSQYLSVIFYVNSIQQVVAEQLIAELIQKSYLPATQIRPVPQFWTAEKYHQNYYDTKEGTPYCHLYRKVF